MTELRVKILIITKGTKIQLVFADLKKMKSLHVKVGFTVIRLKCLTLNITTRFRS